MKLIHYSKAPLESVASKDQYDAPGMKPEGLWLSVGKAWQEWCEGEEFSLGNLERRYSIKLSSNARLLLLTTESSIRAFSDKYGRESEYRGETTGSLYVDWQRLAKQWQGIIIAPYQWRCRLDLIWYYGWDCASGCVWDKEAIASIFELGE